MKKIICWAALVLALCLPVCALAATEPNTRTIEDTTTYEGGTIQITIDQWCYAFNRTSLRFFVANVYVDDPAQLQTAFAGEEYSKSNSEATSAIAERHDAILAVNGDYYNYKDKNGLVIRNGVLYRDEASTRDQLLIMNDGGYGVMRGIQDKYFGGRQYYNELHTPDFTLLAQAIGLQAWSVERAEDFDAVMTEALAMPGPSVVEVRMGQIGALKFAGPPPKTLY